MALLAVAIATVGLNAPSLFAAVAAPDPDPPGGPLALAGPRFEIARVAPGARVELRDVPNGAVIEELGAKTEFDSPRTFHVAERRAGWLGVPSAELPNGVLGWVRDDSAQLGVYETSYSIRADLSDREVTLRWGDRVIERIPVTVGAAGSETPTGTFAVTDGLAGSGVGPYYGCCVLALSGHQPNLPSDWIGGDRIAIHGTPGPIGGAGSLGCLRASDADMVTLFALVPPGTPVFVRA